MQRVGDLPVYLALGLAVCAAYVSLPQTGARLDQRVIALLSEQALAVDMPLDADGEQLFAGP